METRSNEAAVAAGIAINLVANEMEAIEVVAVVRNAPHVRTVRRALERVDVLPHPGGRTGTEVSPTPLAVGNVNGRLLRAKREHERMTKAVNMDTEAKALTGPENQARKGNGAQVRKETDRMYAFACGVETLR